MTKTSKLLESLITENNRVATVQVVFADVKSYSKRRTRTQTQVVDAFMDALRHALDDTAKECVTYCQNRDLNFSTDVIRLPTGDGAAVIFPFDGLPDAHLKFARNLLSCTNVGNRAEKCDRFLEDGWCNCHPHFNLSIGVAEGRGILYKDLNDNYNVAGDVINMAARVMGKAGTNQIIFTDEAFRQIIDMVDDPYLIDQFRTYENVRVKHGLRLTLHQYYDNDAEFINSAEVEDLTLSAKMDSVGKLIGFPSGDPFKGDKKKAFDMLEQMASAFQGIKTLAAEENGPTLDISTEEKPS